MFKECAVCGNEFDLASNIQKYCSKECALDGARVLDSRNRRRDLEKEKNKINMEKFRELFM